MPGAVLIDPSCKVLLAGTCADVSGSPASSKGTCSQRNTGHRGIRFRIALEATS